MMPLTLRNKCILFFAHIQNRGIWCTIQARILANKVCSSRYRQNMASDISFTGGARNANRFKNYSRYYLSISFKRAASVFKQKLLHSFLKLQLKKHF
jgi:hypothetical protein